MASIKKYLTQMPRELKLFMLVTIAMGMAYKKKGDEERAMRSFEKVINIDPDNKMAMFEIRSMTEKK